MKIDIKISDHRTKKPESEKKGKDFLYPTDPVRPGDDPEYVLDIAFYDGTTKPDSSDPTNFVTVPHWETFNGDPSNTDYRSTDATEYYFYQNSNTILPEDVRDDWDGTKTNRDYGIFDRRPFERTLYSDYLLNKEVIPVGVSRPNFEVTLIYPDNAGEAVKVDLKRIFRGGVEGATSDVLVDDTATTGYRIWSPPLTTGHIKVEEKTFNSVFLHIGAGYGEESVLIKDEKISELEGIAWLPFNTADTDNYKITREPYYEADRYTEPPVKMLGQYTRMRVFTFPRKWWVWYHKRAGNATSGKIYGWGSWICPPKDFAMPVPRKGGAWELGHVWDAVKHYDDIPLEDRDITDIVYSESNAHGLFLFNDTQAEGDHDNYDRNAIYTLYAFDSAITTSYIWGQLNDYRHAVYLPGGEFTGFSQMWFSMNWIAAFETDIILDRPTTGFMHTMPDLKEPLAVGERAFHPWMAVNDEDPDEKESYIRRLKAYTDVEGSFIADGIEQKNKVYDTGIEKIVDCDFGLPSEVSSWGFAASGVKEGDLVAVLECGDGVPLYVWRTTDEEFKPSKDFTYESGSHYYMSVPENFIFSGTVPYFNVWNVRGILEWSFVGEETNGRYKFNRKIGQWGTWCDVQPHDASPPGSPFFYKKAVPHRGTITLQQPVTVVACFSIFPNSYKREIY